MPRILYIFPHPDDESFGPAPVLARQGRAGHDVYLLTLTRGEATRQREKYGYTKPEMGAVRVREMECVARTLALADLTVLDFPDGGLADVDVATLEAALRAHIERVRPAVVVTYPAHGISGHPDHRVGHAAIRRVFSALREDGAGYLRRLAFFVLPEDGAEGRPEHLQGTPAAEIDCVVPVDDVDLDRGREALDCYVTYRDVVAAHRPLDQVTGGVCFSFYEEDVRGRVQDVFEGLRNGTA